MYNRAFSSKIISEKSGKKRAKKKKKNNFTASMYNNENEDLMSYNLNSNVNIRNNNNNLYKEINNNFSIGIINPVLNSMKDNILDDLDNNNNIANGIFSIDYLSGKKSKFNSNIN